MDERRLLERIGANPKIFGGKPIIRGRRLAVACTWDAGCWRFTRRRSASVPLAGKGRHPGLLDLRPQDRSQRTHRASHNRGWVLRLLLDTCVSPQAKNELVSAGHDVVWAGDWPEDPGDETILARAYEDGRILVTLDKDFGELAVARGFPHCGIVRLVNFRAGHQAAVCIRVLGRHADDLAGGAIITAEPGILRIRIPYPPTS